MFKQSFRTVAALGLSIALMLAINSPAAAAGPTKTDLSFSFTGAELTRVCAFTVFVDGMGSGTQTDFFNNSGVLIRSAQHVVQQDKFYANGKTLAGIPYTYNVEIRYDSSGVMTGFILHGIVENIPLPDGSLFIGAGQLNVLDHILDHPEQGFFISPDKGNPGNIAGFCAALAP